MDDSWQDPAELDALTPERQGRSTQENLIYKETISQVLVRDVGIGCFETKDCNSGRGRQAGHAGGDRFTRIATHGEIHIRWIIQRSRFLPSRSITTFAEPSSAKNPSCRALEPKGPGKLRRNPCVEGVLITRIICGGIFYQHRDIICGQIHRVTCWKSGWQVSAPCQGRSTGPRGCPVMNTITVNPEVSAKL